MPQITELHILPVLAVARLGSSPDPMVNYDAVVNPADPLGVRRLVGAPTFVVHRPSGKIRERIDRPDVRFRDGRGRIRPVAPFFEVWARVQDALEPLTPTLVRESGYSIDDLSWRVTTANLKIARRTGERRDRIVAHVGPFSDHRIHALEGECQNFIEGRTVPFGHVQYLHPTDDYPEIRLRFTPPKGLLYGAQTSPRGVKAIAVYNRRRGKWKGFEDLGPPAGTSPSDTFSRRDVDDETTLSVGLFDDVSDGIIEVTLASPAANDLRPLRALARVVVAPPAFAPDSFPVRTIADEIEQVFLGPDLRAGDDGADDDSPGIAARAEEIVRRAAETVRLMNVAAMNGLRSRDATTSMPSHDADTYPRRYTPVMAPALADTLAILALHRSILTALKSGTAPWFTDALRRFDEIGDLSDVGRRKMPALMRGSDGRYLALTRRQVEIIRAAALARAGAAAPDEPYKP